MNAARVDHHRPNRKREIGEAPDIAKTHCARLFFLDHPADLRLWPGLGDAWLNPDPADLAAQYAILDDRERPYYEHRMVA